MGDTQSVALSDRKDGVVSSERRGAAGEDKKFSLGQRRERMGSLEEKSE